MIAGLFFLVGAMLLFARAPVNGDYLVDLLPLMLLYGIGAGVSLPALMMLAIRCDAERYQPGLRARNTTARVAARSASRCPGDATPPTRTEGTRLTAIRWRRRCNDSYPLAT